MKCQLSVQQFNLKCRFTITFDPPYNSLSRLKLDVDLNCTCNRDQIIFYNNYAVIVDLDLKMAVEYVSKTKVLDRQTETNGDCTRYN